MERELEKQNEKQEKDNEIKIAMKDIRIYLGQCLIDFQRYDQIVLSAGDGFVEKMIYVANILKAVGIEIDPYYKNKITGKIQLKSEVTEITNPNTGRREKKIFHKLGLTKIPELYMYTDPSNALEFPSINDEE